MRMAQRSALDARDRDGQRDRDPKLLKGGGGPMIKWKDSDLTGPISDHDQGGKRGGRGPKLKGGRTPDYRPSTSSTDSLLA